MKPSELIKSYILSKQLPKQQNELSKYFECCFERLDNNFIDREELKDKIKKLNYSLDIRDKMPYKQKVYLEEVLELIK